MIVTTVLNEPRLTISRGCFEPVPNGYLVR
jgi:hypothetical protein